MKGYIFVIIILLFYIVVENIEDRDKNFSCIEEIKKDRPYKRVYDYERRQRTETESCCYLQELHQTVCYSAKPNELP